MGMGLVLGTFVDVQIMEVAQDSQTLSQLYAWEITVWHDGL